MDSSRGPGRGSVGLIAFFIAFLHILALEIMILCCVRSINILLASDTLPTGSCNAGAVVRSSIRAAVSTSATTTLPVLAHSLPL